MPYRGTLLLTYFLCTSILNSGFVTQEEKPIPFHYQLLGAVIIALVIGTLAMVFFYIESIFFTFTMGMPAPYGLALWMGHWFALAAFVIGIILMGK